MVEYTHELDSIFLSLSDGTRRDILRLLNIYEKMSVSDIAIHYRLTFAAVSKHLMVLERAKLIHKRKKGRQQMIRLNASAFQAADEYLKQYEQLWHDRFNRLEKVLQATK